MVTYRVENECTRSGSTSRVDSGCSFCLGLVGDSGCFIASGVKRGIYKAKGLKVGGALGISDSCA